MVSRRILFTRLIEFMASQGFRLVDESIGEGFIRFRGNDREVVLHIIEEADRDEILLTVIRAAFDTASGKAAYVVMPTELLSKIGDYAFRIHKIGVLVYDSHGILELVSGEPRLKAINATPSSSTDKDYKHFEVILESLSARLARVEEAFSRLSMLEELKTRLDSLEEAVLNQMAQKPVKEGLAIKNPQARVVKEHVRPREDDEGMPSFLKDNPWLDILSEKSS